MLRDVELPGGEIVKVPSELSSDWFTHKKTGYLDPKWLAPYADQPRMHMNEADLQELQASVASQGVRESLVITPVKFAPWATFHPGDEHLPFLIVSGHRRRQTAKEAGIPAVPVEVRIYADREAFEDDADILNDHRADLSEIEQGYRFQRKLERGVKISHLVGSTGHSYVMIMGRINLTRLCPTIKKFVAPELQPRQRLSIGFAGALGGLRLPESDDDLKNKLAELGDEKPFDASLSDDEKRFRLQRAYLAFCQKQRWRGLDSKKFVETGEYSDLPGVRHGHHSRSLGEEQPKSVPFRYELIALIQHLNDLGLLDMSEREVSDKLKLAVRQDVIAMGQCLEIAGQMLIEVGKKKREWSARALEGQHRPEQKVLVD